MTRFKDIVLVCLPFNGIRKHCLVQPTHLGDRGSDQSPDLDVITTRPSRKLAERMPALRRHLVAPIPFHKRLLCCIVPSVQLLVAFLLDDSHWFVAWPAAANMISE